MLARIPMESAKTRDITGGLPRVAELFEARRPKDHAIIAEIDGHDPLRPRLQEQAADHPRADARSRGGRIPDPEGQAVPSPGRRHRREGRLHRRRQSPPHDILAIKGIEALAAYLVNEIQDVYRLQGVTINDKHIEVIVRQMLQKIEITDPGDTDMFPGEQIDQIDLEPSTTR